MTNTANLTIQRRSIVGDLDGTDSLILYCSEGDSTLITTVLNVPSATSDDASKFVKGTIIKPTIEVATSGEARPTSPNTDSTGSTGSASTTTN